MLLESCESWGCSNRHVTQNAYSGSLISIDGVERPAIDELNCLSADISLLFPFTSQKPALVDARAGFSIS